MNKNPKAELLETLEIIHEVLVGTKFLPQEFQAAAKAIHFIENMIKQTNIQDIQGAYEESDEQSAKNNEE